MAVQLGTGRDIGDGYGLNIMSAAAFIADRIAARYANPGRAAYLYLFQVKAGSALEAMPPDTHDTLAAWYDEGDGLAPAVAEDAAARCRATFGLLQMVGEQGRRLIAPADRRRLMARLVVFSVAVPSETGELPAKVELFSRALAFTPKGDRRATETWKRSPEGWFSAYVPHGSDL